MTAEADPTIPRVLRSSPRRTIGLLAGFAVAAAIGGLMMRDDAPWGWAVVAFGVVGLVVFLVIAVRPNRLELTQGGLATVTLGRRWSAEWHECGEFRTWQGPDLGSSRMIVFDCSAPGVRGHPLEKLAESIAGANGGLPETYGLPADELAALLNRYRQAYGGGGPPAAP